MATVHAHAAVGRVAGAERLNLLLKVDVLTPAAAAAAAAARVRACAGCS
jgi:hypothetical protein